MYIVPFHIVVMLNGVFLVRCLFVCLFVCFGGFSFGMSIALTDVKEYARFNENGEITQV